MWWSKKKSKPTVVLLPEGMRLDDVQLARVRKKFVEFLDAMPTENSSEEEKRKFEELVAEIKKGKGRDG